MSPEDVVGEPTTFSGYQDQSEMDVWGPAPRDFAAIRSFNSRPLHAGFDSAQLQGAQGDLSSATGGAIVQTTEG